MTLPWPPDRAHLRGFGLAAAAAASTASALAWWLGGPAWGLPGLGIGLLVAAASWTRPGSIEPAYRGWNAGADFYIRAARYALAAVCFAVVWAAGRAGTRLPWRPPRSGSSGWRERRPASARGEAGRRAKGAAETSTGGWIRRYVGWSRASRNGWALALLPYLFLLHRLGGRRQRSLDDNVYTLF